MISASRTCSSMPFGTAHRSILLGRDGTRAIFSVVIGMLVLAWPLAASTVTGAVQVTGVRNHMENSGVVVWLDPKDDPPPAPQLNRARMVQRDKQFQPHVLAVQVGTTVDFPNLDPIFHNAFSNIDGKPFDVGLYRPGTSRSVVFDRVGIVHVFCNIHQSMSAVIVVEDTPWLAVTTRGGQFRIPNVPEGRYTMHVFYERATRETLDNLERTIEVVDGTTRLPVMQISETGYIEAPHKNKYGRDYPAEGDGSYTGTQ